MISPVKGLLWRRHKRSDSHRASKPAYNGVPNINATILKLRQPLLDSLDVPILRMHMRVIVNAIRPAHSHHTCNSISIKSAARKSA